MTEPNFSEIRPTPVNDPMYKVPDHRAPGEPPPRFGPQNTGKFIRGGKSAPPPLPPIGKAEKTDVSFEQPLLAIYAAFAFAVNPVAPNVATTILKQSHECARAWDALAKENESVRKALEALTTVSTGGMVVIAHIPIVQAVANEVSERKAAKRAAEEAAQYAEDVTPEPEYVRG